jgi:hypothetical protein
MGKPLFRRAAGGDGSIQLPSVSRHLLVHGIGTIVLVITLVAAAWGFWIGS